MGNQNNKFGGFMKNKLIFIILLMLLLPMSIFSGEEEPSVWAKDFIDKVSEQDILKEDFFKDYKKNITRGDFAYLGVKLYEHYTGKIATVGDATFTDTSDEWVLKAKNMGFIGGYPDGSYLPEKDITREELAVLFVNLFNASGIEYLPSDNEAFVDDEKISTWAKASVYIAKKNGIVRGVGENRFDPRAKATKEQAIIMFNNVQTSPDLINSGIVKKDLFVETIYPPEFILSKEKIELGEYTSIIARNIYSPEDLYIKQALNPNAKFIKNGDHYLCILPATYYTQTGSYPLEYGLEGSLKIVDEIEIVNRKFSIQYLTVDKQTETETRSSEAYDQYNLYYKPALSLNVYQDANNDTELGQFILPVKGRLTTEYGQNRYVNGSPTSYNHAGYDIAANRGTEVVSTYKGQVVLAMELILTGKSVVVNHGNGLFSTYFHLDQMSVSKDDVVESGQKIGEVGSTGFSTGPHLHFSISFYNLNLEPGYFLYNEKVTYENYIDLFNSK